MSKDNIGWVDKDRMKTSIAALRALRKKPSAAPNAASSESAPLERLFDASPTADEVHDELRPITDLRGPETSTEAATTHAPDNTQEVRRPHLADDAADERFEHGFPAATDQITESDDATHVDRSLVQALHMLRDAEQSPFDAPAMAPFDDGPFQDATAHFRRDENASAAHVDALPFEAVAPAEIAPSELAPARHGGDTVPIPRADEVFDDIDRQSDAMTESAATELDEFDIPFHRSSQKIFYTDAFDVVPPSGGPSKLRDFDSDNPFTARITRDIGAERFHSSLEAVTAATPVVDEEEVSYFPAAPADTTSAAPADTTSAAPAAASFAGWTSPPTPKEHLSVLNWLRAVERWTRSLDNIHGFFAADADGLPLFARNVTDDRIALAIATRTAIVAARHVPSERTHGSLSYSVDEATFCHLLWQETAQGLLTLGFNTGSSIPSDALAPLASALQDATVQLPLT